MQEVRSHIKNVERKTGRRFGDPQNPLLVSVRSGAALSMPGMMDTILNLGINDLTVQGLVANIENERFAWDTYRRLIQLFSEIALGAEKDSFSKAFDDLKKKYGGIYGL